MKYAARSTVPMAARPSRRDILNGIASGFAGFGASTLLPTASLPAQNSPGGPRIIDIHRHFISPAFLKVLNAKQGRKVEGFTSFFPLAPWKDYSPARDIETKDRQGLAASLDSPASPGTWFGDRDEARGLAREMKEYGAKMA